MPPHQIDGPAQFVPGVDIDEQRQLFFGRKNIADGKYDIQALGRQLFCDPNYVKKLEAGTPKDIKRCARCNFCMLRCQTFLTPACPHNPQLGREYANDEYKISSEWQPHEPLIPEALMRDPMPSVDRPWWKNKLPLIEKNWRALRGRTSR